MPPNFKQFKAARKYGYRSGLEVKISDYLKELKVDFGYECVKIEWEDLAYRTYTPDFVLPNGIIIETKGMFTAADRRKHLAIKRQHPNLDIRFVFETVDVSYVRVLSLPTESGVTSMDFCATHVSFQKNGSKKKARTNIPPLLSLAVAR